MNKKYLKKVLTKQKMACNINPNKCEEAEKNFTEVSESQRQV